MSRVVRGVVILFFFAFGAAIAADDKPPASGNDNAENVPQEPDVTITQRGQERIEEYRVNNQVYMIKITPAKGYPYYLIDDTGDGNFDTRRPQLNSTPIVPQWVLLRWK